MEILHYSKPIKVEELLNLIDTKQKTLLIIPDKYHFTIYHNILNKSKIIFNLSLLSPNNFLKSVLSDNNLVIDEQISIIKKIQINNNLEIDHQYKNNLNFINELFKLKQELFYSNIKYDNQYAEYLNHQFIDFTNFSLTINYDLIIYCDEDFYPIHQQLLNTLKTNEIKQIETSNINTKKYYEHSNTIRMLDYIIKDIYEKDYDELLIIVDDPIQQDYLINQLNILNIPTNNLNKINNLNISLIKALFNIINGKNNDYDLKNIKKLNLEVEEIINLNSEDYHNYLKKLYDILIKTELFDLSYLNNLFTKLYLIEDSNITLLNKLLINQFTNKLSNPSSNISNIIIGNSTFTSLHFKNVIVVDSALKNFNSTNASYLLNTQQRQVINDNLISNTYYLEQFHSSQQRLLSCGNNIMFHFALLTLDNKSQDLAYFIKLDNKQATNQEHILLENKDEPYVHLSIQDKLNDSLLINNESKPLKRANLLKRFNNEIRISASALDKIHSCPYKYLVANIYKPRIDEAFSYLNLGNIQHHVIEIINQELINTKQTFKTYPYNNFLAIIDKYTYEEIYNDEKTNYDNVDKDYILKKIKENLINFVDSMIYYQNFTKFNIDASEIELRVDYPNEYFDNAYLIGKVDAIMKYNNLYYVLDYKASENKFSEVNLERGLKNQLIMYLKLLKENNYPVFAAFFKAIKDDFVELKSEQINEVLNDSQLLNTLHLSKNPYCGVASSKYDIIALDYQLIDKISTITDVNSKSYHYTFKTKGFTKGGKEKKDIEDYLVILDQNINNMLEIINSANFNAQPLSKDECNYCQYKVICKYYFKEIDEEDNEEVEDDE